MDINNIRLCMLYYYSAYETIRGQMESYLEAPQDGYTYNQWFNKMLANPFLMLYDSNVWQDLFLFVRHKFAGAQVGDWLFNSVYGFWAPYNSLMNSIYNNPERIDGIRLVSNLIKNHSYLVTNAIDNYLNVLKNTHNY